MFMEWIKGRSPYAPRAAPEGRQHLGHVEAVQNLLELLTAFFSQGVACSGGGGETRVRVRVRVRPTANLC